MGWALLAILAIAALGSSWLLGVPRILLSLVAAALMVGATGYALQGRPALGGVSATPEAETVDVDLATSELRTAMVGRFTYAHSYFVAADALTRAGAAHAAAQWMLSGVNRAGGNNYALWMGLGSTLSENDGRTLSPAATFAFRQSMRIAPRQPAPPFFYGLALVRAGDFAAARPLWARAVALSPQQAPYREELELRLGELDQFLAMIG